MSEGALNTQGVPMKAHTHTKRWVRRATTQFSSRLYKDTKWQCLESHHTKIADHMLLCSLHGTTYSTKVHKQDYRMCANTNTKHTWSASVHKDLLVCKVTNPPALQQSMHQRNIGFLAKTDHTMHCSIAEHLHDGHTHSLYWELMAWRSW